MHGVTLTKTQREAHERSRAFRERIATLALKLQVQMEAPVPKIVVKPKLETEQPAPKPLWFAMVPEPGEPLPQRETPSIADIQRVICQRYNITKNDLLSVCREWRVAHPRQIAMYLCRDLTPKSLPEIGRRFGKRDHSTAHHAYHKVRNKIASDEAFAVEIAKLKERLA